jgi:ABC-type glutathione transport system ATPase component
MLIGLIPKDSGTIEFDGEDISNIDDAKHGDVRRRIAYVFQGAALFDSISVGENVAYGLREQSWKTMSESEIQARVAHSLELVGLQAAMQSRDRAGRTETCPVVKTSTTLGGACRNGRRKDRTVYAGRLTAWYVRTLLSACFARPFAPEPEFASAA